MGILSQSYKPSPDALLNPLADPTFKTLFTDKQSEFDINCKIEGKVVNIEVQGMNNDDHYGKRVDNKD